MPGRTNLRAHVRFPGRVGKTHIRQLRHDLGRVRLAGFVHCSRQHSDPDTHEGIVQVLGPVRVACAVGFCAIRRGLVDVSVPGGDLLSNTDRQITSICFDLGYKNVANFNRRLLADKKLTAREYRKQTRQRLIRGQTPLDQSTARQPSVHY